MESTIPENGRRALPAFAVLVVLAGGNGVAVRVLNRSFEPLWGATARFASAAVLFLAIASALRLPRPRGRAAVGGVLYGLLYFGAGFGLVHWALVEVHAGLSQTLLAAVPLITIFLARAHGLERLRVQSIGGALLALAGIGLIFARAVPSSVPLLSVGAILLTAVCWAEATVVVKRFPDVHPAWMNAVAMAVGAVVVLTASLASGEHRVLPGEMTGEAWRALGYLVVPGSVAVFALYVYVLRYWDASAASFQMVLIPLVTVPLSAVIDQEDVTVTFVAGAVLVLAGTYQGALRRLRIDSRRNRSKPGIQPAIEEGVG